MTNEDYMKNVARLKEIEAIVKDPETGLDKIEGFLEETKRLVTECHEYTRCLKDKVESLSGTGQE